jgi:hypothetical protein
VFAKLVTELAMFLAPPVFRAANQSLTLPAAAHVNTSLPIEKFLRERTLRQISGGPVVGTLAKFGQVCCFPKEFFYLSPW